MCLALLAKIDVSKAENGSSNILSRFEQLWESLAKRSRICLLELANQFGTCSAIVAGSVGSTLCQPRLPPPSIPWPQKVRVDHSCLHDFMIMKISLSRNAAMQPSNKRLEQEIQLLSNYLRISSRFQ